MNWQWLFLHQVLLFCWCWGICMFDWLLFFYCNFFGFLFLFSYISLYSCRMRCGWWLYRNFRWCYFFLEFWYLMFWRLLLFIMYWSGGFWLLLFYFLSFLLDLPWSTVNFWYNRLLCKTKIGYNFVSFLNSIITLPLGATV